MAFTLRGKAFTTANLRVHHADITCDRGARRKQAPYFPNYGDPGREA